MRDVSSHRFARELAVAGVAKGADDAPWMLEASVMKLAQQLVRQKAHADRLRHARATEEHQARLQQHEDAVGRLLRW